ncbi:molybdopterin converting factor subunit 1 [Rhizorhabdus dicambivorans]|uniref:Molybdopterin synthase sulfur carrier subunit n=1 Tax=Rhizorhabdus dicambivorans TaxID=1850238 RepID=A0A2A4FRU8_9SPHN|nr:molybdopterin converting factor subunit 1 [Rhizorhabdus dicambivorans]ATE63779.1 molybdopterin converting factor subunit 1 [Rhizorhabdus dicambivorans]PCE40422.1 molybdopterin converting factor subunit 1 [Rhizorhabdus dicambivorans]
MAIELLYFARVREAIGRSAETVSPPPEVTTVAGLIEWLAARGGGYAEAFEDRARVRAAIGDAFADPETPIAGAREIALFPPVTGG